MGPAFEPGSGWAYSNTGSTLSVFGATTDATADLVKTALRGSPRFLLETDYIDDPRRPGAVLGPATVPRKTRAWLESGVLKEDEAWRIHKDLPERTYRIEFRE